MSLSTIDSHEWGKLFPLDLNTESDSTLFIQRLFTFTLSALTPKRGGWVRASKSVGAAVTLI